MCWRSGIDEDYYAHKNSNSNILTVSSKSTPSSSLEQQPRSDSETSNIHRKHADSQTEVESDISESEVEIEELTVELQHFDHVVGVLESRLLTILDHDLGLAARIIPRIHFSVSLVFRTEIAAHTTAPSQAASGSSETQEPSNNSLSTTTS